MPHSLPGVKELFGAPLRGAGNPNHDEHTSAVALVEQKDALVKAATEATISGLSGETYFGNNHESGAPMIAKRDDKRAAVRKALEELEMAKSVDPAAMAALNAALTGAKSEMLSKEWTLSNPVSTGLVPFDLEQPAKLLTPRPTPLRNSIPRVKGQGSSRRFKVISGFTGTGTGGISTLNPGQAEGSTNTGPGGLTYIRPPYISYD